MIHFLKYRWIYAVISGVVIGVGLFSVLRWGFIYSVDFVGGTYLQYSLKNPIALEKVKQIAGTNSIEVLSVAFEKNVLILRTKALPEGKESQFRNTLEKESKNLVTPLRSETVGPVLGAEMIRKTIVAALIGVVGILLYMSFAFKGFTFAIAAIIALLHDVLVVVGSYSLLSHFFGAQLDTLFVTAMLTTMSFSVHDTIVIFDKIREYFSKEGKSEIEYYANRALTETLVRSINNSMTIVFMLLALLLLGGSTIRFFVAALLIGTITGTYSSPFVATPIVVWFEKMKKR